MQLQTIALIILQISITFAFGYAIYLLLQIFLGLQLSIGLTLSLRLVGLIPDAAGVTFGFYTLRYRRPKEMLASTSITLMKLFRRKPIRSPSGRTEPFKPAGPYRYVRNPLYFSVVVIILGFGIMLSSVILLLWDVALVSWFWFFLIPFEEKELGALFGGAYAEYRRQVPKLFPYRKGYRAPAPEKAN